jgi:hypothetical protein
MNDCADICGGVLHLVWHKDNEKLLSISERR